MFSDVILLHRSVQKGGSALAPFATPEAADAGWLQWKTCLRQIALGSQESLEAIQNELTSEDEVYVAEDAYRFLLQVICGLHSPLVGETEVYGQFKNAVAEFTLPVTPWGGQMRRFFKTLFEDAKRVRQQHLVDLGSQSYGSVLRRELREHKKVHVLGAGHLVQEILPWLCKDGNEVHVHSRNPRKAMAALSAFPGVHFHALDEAGSLQGAEGLIIAAPVTAAWIREWIASSGGATSIEAIADTRGDSAEDRISEGFDSSARILTLSDLLTRISDNQVQLMNRKRQALNAINEFAFERGRHVEYRPFGWEDVCA